MSDEFDGSVLAAIARLERKVDDLGASQRSQAADVAAIRAEIGQYPSFVDIARASVSDLSPAELMAKSEGTGICGAIYRLSRNDATIVAEVRKSSPTALARQSDRKATVAAALGAIAAVVSAMLGATR